MTPSTESVPAAPQQPSSHRPPKPRRPNYNLIHQYPVPLRTQPLPPLFPHNPLSYIHVAWAYLTQYFAPSPSHPETLYRAYLSPETCSVHVTDDKTVRALWEMGFFGKGSLSRSEPEWVQQERKKRGLGQNETSMELTRKRREERRQFKLQRAREEREAVKRKLKEEEGLGDIVKGNSGTELKGHANGDIQESHSPGDARTEDDTSSTEEAIANSDRNINKSSELENEVPKSTRDDVSIRSSSSSKTVRFSPKVERLEFETPTPIDANGANADTMLTDPFVKNQEHLQLTCEEAFFLTYGLGVLQIYEPDLQTPISTVNLFQRFVDINSSCSSISPLLDPDSPFLISYVAYHRFRSLGWVVRSGTKFSVDYLLYNRGPAFSHAEFAVTVLPSYTHEYWTTTEEGRKRAAEHETTGWWWLHCINRVQTSVQKNLVLCFVEVPPPEPWESPYQIKEQDTDQDSSETETGDIDIGRLLKRYKVREINIKRWSPNRMRDKK